jgi:carbonic anhydrase
MEVSMSLKNLQPYIEGFARFKEDWYQSRSQVKKIFGSQHPKVLVIACSDSRVDPALLFDGDPGDFFMVRNVASLVPQYVKDGAFHGISAAIEYAVRGLKVKDIIVLGHTHCGGITSLMKDPLDENTEFLGQWLHIAYPAYLRVNVMEHVDEDAMQRACERESILVSLGNLLTFPWLKSLVDTGELNLHGWYFNMTAGTIERWSPKDKGFVPLVD